MSETQEMDPPWVGVHSSNTRLIDVVGSVGRLAGCPATAADVDGCRVSGHIICTSEGERIPDSECQMSGFHSSAPFSPVTNVVPLHVNRERCLDRISKGHRCITSVPG